MASVNPDSPDFLASDSSFSPEPSFRQNLLEERRRTREDQHADPHADVQPLWYRGRLA